MKVCYRINGESVTAKEYERHMSRRRKRMGYSTDAESVQDMVESGMAPGGHGTFWADGRMTSVAAGVAPHQAKEHAEWVQKQGLAGVSVNKEGEVEFGSPGAREKYLKARGLTDWSSAGSGEYKGLGGSTPDEVEARSKRQKRKADHDAKVQEQIKEDARKRTQEILHKAGITR